jgi:hypothetical protein
MQGKLPQRGITKGYTFSCFSDLAASLPARVPSALARMSETPCPSSNGRKGTSTWLNNHEGWRSPTTHWSAIAIVSEPHWAEKLKAIRDKKERFLDPEKWREAVGFLRQCQGRNRQLAGGGSGTVTESLLRPSPQRSRVLRRCFGCESQATGRDARSAIVRPHVRRVYRIAYSLVLLAELPPGPVGNHVNDV